MEIPNTDYSYMQTNGQIGGKKTSTSKKKTTVKKESNIGDDEKNINLNITNKKKVIDKSLSNNNIRLDDIFRFVDLYFKQKNIMYTHLYNSFDKLLDEDIPNFLKDGNSTFFEKVTKDKIYRYKFKFKDIAIKPPFIDMDDEIMYPQQARLRNLTYSSKLVATITQVQEITDVATDKTITRVIGEPEYEYPITNIPKIRMRI